MKKIVLLVLTLFVIACGTKPPAVENPQFQDSNMHQEEANSKKVEVLYERKNSSESYVEIITSISDAEIRYTTDGTVPTKESKLYENVFVVNENTNNIKVMVYKKGENKYVSKEKIIPINKMPLTILYYGGADNDLEEQILEDIEEMKVGYNRAGYNLVVLFDRAEGYTSTINGFGENFTDTRLYQIREKSVERLSGEKEMPQITESSKFEMNMGDANTLKQFIEYGKNNFPADNYILIMSNHGGGPRGGNLSSGKTKAICWDEASKDEFDSQDTLYTAEITDILNESHSVDLLAFDACLMGSVEVAYQFKPSNNDFNTKYMVASADLVRGEGFHYTNILQRLKLNSNSTIENNYLDGGQEKNIDLESFSVIDFGKMLVEEQYDDTLNDSSQTLSLYDLGKIDFVKTTVDNLAIALDSSDSKELFENGMGYLETKSVINYFDMTNIQDWISNPFYDLYDMARCINLNSDMSELIRNNAKAVINAVDSLVLASFGGSDFKNTIDNTKFEKGKNGIQILFPNNTRVKLNDGSVKGSMYFMSWYTPLNSSELERYPYGKLEFLMGGTSDGNVDNWFELIDKWYDDNEIQEINNGNGYNFYKY